MRKLGIRGAIVYARDLSTILRGLKEVEEAIILTDFDEEGAELARKLKWMLERAGVRANDWYWRELRALVGRSVKGVEDLYGYIERNAPKFKALYGLLEAGSWPRS